MMLLSKLKQIRLQYKKIISTTDLSACIYRLKAIRIIRRLFKKLLSNNLSLHYYNGEDSGVP